MAPSERQLGDTSSRARRRADRPSSIRCNVVLDAVKPGRVWLVNLTPAERSTLDDDEGRFALSVLQHLLGARERVVRGRPWEPTPLTGETFRRVAARLGVRVGENRCLRLIQRLREAGVLIEDGSYRPAAGSHRVTLYRVVSRVAAAGLRPSKFSVHGRGFLKANQIAPWWQHSLFGNPDGRPPPGTPKSRLKNWRRHTTDRATVHLGLPYERLSVG